MPPPKKKPADLPGKERKNLTDKQLRLYRQLSRQRRKGNKLTEAQLDRYRKLRYRSINGKWPPGTDSDSGGFSDDEQSAFDSLQAYLESVGLTRGRELVREIKKIVTDGVVDPFQIQQRLQDTQAWKIRFSGNEYLEKDGQVLSVDEYLKVEKSMAAVMKNAGLPANFYDGPEDFGRLIGKKVSATELQDRVTAWSDLMRRNEDPEVMAALEARGINRGEALAFFIDPDRAKDIVLKKYQSTLIGAAAANAGRRASSVNYTDKLAGMGITEQEARQGYGAIGEMLPTLSKLSDIYRLDDDYDIDDAEAEVFESSDKAARKRQRLASAERAAFSGSSGAGKGSLGSTRSGSY